MRPEVEFDEAMKHLHSAVDMYKYREEQRKLNRVIRWLFLHDDAGLAKYQDRVAGIEARFEKLVLR